jgi:integrase/recombinase XerC/integrase/recombinase XerD
MAGAHLIRISSFNHLAENLPAAIESFLNYCRSKNLSGETVKYYRYRLQAFARFLAHDAPGTAPKDVTPQVVRSFIAWEVQRNSPATANHSLVALRAFFNYLVRDGFLESSPVAGVEKVRCRRTVIDTFTLDQLEAVLKTCGKSFTGVRDRAMIVLLFDCGLRVSELCGLTLDDICWNEQTLAVVGKGDKERIVPFGSAARQALVQYLGRREDLATKALFVTCYGDPIGRFRGREIVADRCKAAGITGVRCSPHTLRHTFAVTYLRAGGDVFSLQKMLGHSDLTMTRRYCELSQTDVVEKHRLYSPADRLRAEAGTAGRRRLK